MTLPSIHAAVDALAMWSEEWHTRPPIPFRAAADAPLDCFGPLPPLPAPPRPAGPWRAPSPRPSPGDALIDVTAHLCRGRCRGTAVLVPPWKLPRLSLLSGWVSLLTEAGYDTWTLIPPRHLHRAPPGVRSGETFVSPDLAAFRSAFEQLVMEIRVLAALAGRRAGQVALVGLSLGGLAAAMAATGPERVDRAVVVAPPADLSAVALETRIGRRIRALAARAGTPAPAAAALGAMFDPFRAAARRPIGARTLVAVGTEDRIAAPAAAEALAGRWGAELRRYHRGHLTLLFACGALRRDVVRFLEASRPLPALTARTSRAREAEAKLA